MKPLITIDYTLTRTHRTPRFTVRSPMPGTAIRYSIGEPVSNASPVYMKSVSVNFGDVVFAAIFRGSERVGEIASEKCVDHTINDRIDVTHNAPTTVSEGLSTKNKTIASTDSVSSKPQFDGTWGSSEW